MTTGSSPAASSGTARNSSSRDSRFHAQPQGAQRIRSPQVVRTASPFVLSESKLRDVVGALRRLLAGSAILLCPRNRWFRLMTKIFDFRTALIRAVPTLLSGDARVNMTPGATALFLGT